MAVQSVIISLEDLETLTFYLKKILEGEQTKLHIFARKSLSRLETVSSAIQRRGWSQIVFDGKDARTLASLTEALGMEELSMKFSARSIRV